MGKRKRVRVVKRRKKVQHKRINAKQIPNLKARELWDPKKSVRENYANLGLTYIQNKKTQKPFTNQKVEQIPLTKSPHDSDSEDNYQIQSSQASNVVIQKNIRPHKITVDIFNIPSETSYKKTIKKLSYDERAIIKALIAKYKDDFKAMFKDIKINSFQWTKAQIKKIYNQYMEEIQLNQ